MNLIAVYQAAQVYVQRSAGKIGRLRSRSLKVIERVTLAYYFY